MPTQYPAIGSNVIMVRRNFNSPDVEKARQCDLDNCDLVGKDKAAHVVTKVETDLHDNLFWVWHNARGIRKELMKLNE